MIVRTDRWDVGVEVHHATTERRDGDFALGAEPPVLAAARQAAVDLPWVWLRQVHGATVHVVRRGQEDDVRALDGDALVTGDPGVVLAVQTADCVPVSFSSPEGVIGVAHAGWRGIEAGVVEATVATMRANGASRIRATIGPCIHAGCYEFGAEDLDRLVATLGPHAASTTSTGAPALDTIAAVRHVLDAAGLEVAEPADPGVGPFVGARPTHTCTACQPGVWFSHRARAEPGRMATVVWRDPVDPTGTRS